jgi:hypothetical protein
VARNRSIPSEVRKQVRDARAASPDASRPGRLKVSPGAQWRPKPTREFNLPEGGLVTLFRDTVGFNVADIKNAYVHLKRGTVGVLISRDSGSTNGAKQCRVMLPAGLVDVSAAVLRECGDEVEE